MKLTYSFVVNKIEKVFFGCKTEEQIKVADNYCNLLTKQYKKQFHNNEDTYWLKEYKRILRCYNENSI